MNTNNKDYDASPNDLIELLKYSFSIVSKIVSFLKEVFIKKIIFILCITIIAVVLGYFKQYISKPIYKVSMQVNQNEIPEKVFIKKITVITDLIETRSYNTIAEKLHVEHNVAMSICDLSIENISGVASNKDSTDIGSFLVKAELTDNTQLNSLQNGIIKYLNDFKYLNQIKKVRRKLFYDRLLFIGKQLIQLDSFKVAYIKSMGRENNGSVNLVLGQNDMAYLFNQSNELMFERDRLNQELELHEQLVYLTDGFSKSERPNRGSTLSNVLKFFCFGFLGSYLVALIMVLNNKIRNRALVN